MSIPFPPDFEKDVTTLPFAGQRQPFTGAFPPFAAPLPLFFRPPAELLLLLAEPCEADFFGVAGALALLDDGLEGAGCAFFELLPPALDERLAVCVEELAGGRVRRSFCPG